MKDSGIYFCEIVSSKCYYWAFLVHPLYTTSEDQILYTTRVQPGQKLLSLLGQKKITKLDFMTHLLLKPRPINQEKGETKKKLRRS